MSDDDKLSYLILCLKGEAALVVEGYEPVKANYKAIRRALEKENGDSTALRLRLHTELRNLSVKDESLKASWRMVREAEKIVYQLKMLGEDVEHPFVKAAISLSRHRGPEFDCK